MAHDQVCVNVAPQVGVTSWGSAATDDGRKRAVAQGTVVAGIEVYEDFTYYKSGVYRHVAGDFLGLHAVPVIGYDDNVASWIVKTSWSGRWGMLDLCTLRMVSAESTPISRSTTRR